MKVEELMIGDLILFPKNGGYVKVKHLDLINDNKIIINNGDVLKTFKENYKPISLTPEILKKNGFEEIGFVYRSTIDGYRVTLTHFHENNFALTIATGMTDCEGKGNMELNIRYVHELQHSFRLFEINKEIAL